MEMISVFSVPPLSALCILKSRALAVGADFVLLFAGLLRLGKSSVTEKKILDLEKSVCVCIYSYIYIQDENILKAGLNRRVNHEPVMETPVVWSKKWEYTAFVVETCCLYYLMCI